MKMLVLGGAVSGTAAARLGRRLGRNVAIYDRDPGALTELSGEQFAVHSGDWDPMLLRGTGLVVTSPGIPASHAAIGDALAAGVPVWSELEFVARRLDVPYAAVTGTNGKTTAASVAGAMLQMSGVPSVVAGNIGTAASDIVDEPWDAVVLEASSFQLRFIEEFHPTAAAVLNVAPDHLDWHGSAEDYAQSKARIFENQGPDDLLLYDADDSGAAALVTAARSRVIPVSGTRLPEGGYGPDGDRLFLPGLVVPRPALDPAFLVDVVVAVALAMRLGALADPVASAIAGFRPGPHRRTVVGAWDGVEWIDDSKATNPHAAASAAAAYPSVVLIAGGRNKGLDLEPLAQAATVRRIVAIGEAGGELRAIAPEKVVMADDMSEAVAIADGIARPGDTVLLAPGCASFDMYASYAERGEKFVAAVLERKGSVDDDE